MEGTNHNSPCSFAVEIVGYIYDEMNRETKANFETHVANCSSCADELAGFGIVRSKVSDWKLNEFSTMSTPIVELPIVQTVENTQVKRRLFDSLRDLLTLSPAWINQTAAFATLTICVGIGYFAFSNSQNMPAIDEVNPPKDEIAVATPKPKPTEPIKVSPTPTIELPDQKPPVTVIKTVAPTASKKVVVEAVQTDVKPTVTVPKAKSNRVEKRPIARKQRDVNLVSDDDDDDDSLRLSDLFEEISMK
jgi:hypothetical protein